MLQHILSLWTTSNWYGFILGVIYLTHCPSLWLLWLYRYNVCYCMILYVFKITIFLYYYFSTLLIVICTNSCRTHIASISFTVFLCYFEYFSAFYTLSHPLLIFAAITHSFMHIHNCIYFICTRALRIMSLLCLLRSFEFK